MVNISLDFYKCRQHVPLQITTKIKQQIQPCEKHLRGSHQELVRMFDQN